MKNSLTLTRIIAILFAFITCISICACEGETHNTSNGNNVSDNSSTISAKVAVNNDYVNPIYPIVNGEKTFTYQADPFVVRDDDGVFYLYCTQTSVYTPMYAFRRGPVFKSYDMHSWEYVSDVFADYVPNWGTSGAGVWAPTVIKVGGKWNFYYSLSTGGDENPGIGVATSPTPYGPWTHYGKLFNSNEIGVTNSIDPYVFYDNDELYMVFGSYGGLITLIELTDDGLGLKGGLDYQKEHKVALAGYEIFENNNYEGSFILKKEGWYYLLLSTGACLSGAASTYHVVVCRSQNLKGPYIDSQGRDMFKPNRGDPVVVPSKSGAMGTGHCAVMTDDNGEFWLIYHGYDTTSSNPDSRVLYIDKLLWNETTGMPYVNNTKASNGVTMAGPYINNLEGN